MNKTDLRRVGGPVKFISPVSGCVVDGVIMRLDASYPLTSYTVTWKNDGEPPDCDGFYSVLHCKNVMA